MSYSPYGQNPPPQPQANRPLPYGQPYRPYGHLPNPQSQGHLPYGGGRGAMPMGGVPSPSPEPSGRSPSPAGSSHNNSSQHSHSQSPAVPAPIVVQQKYKKLPKIELPTAHREQRHRIDNLADLYAILVCIEHLETAWTRGSIKDDVYTRECSAQISKFKTQRENVESYEPDIEKFCRDHRMQCYSALKRVAKGIPGTIENPSIIGSDEKSDVYVAETVEHFITTMDCLKLDQRAVDDLQPNVHDLMESLNKVSSIPPDHTSKEKVKEWLVKLNKMRAADELDDDQARQMTFDLEQGYTSFTRFLSKKK